jgi:hypothetical protein
MTGCGSCLVDESSYVTDLLLQMAVKCSLKGLQRVVDVQIVQSLSEYQTILGFLVADVSHALHGPSFKLGACRIFGSMAIIVFPLPFPISIAHASTRVCTATTSPDRDYQKRNISRS